MEKLIFAGVAIILFLAASVILYMIGDHVLSTEQRQRVTIIERGVVTSSPTYELFLEFEDGTRKIVRTDEDTHVNIYTDEIITLTCHYGKWPEELLRCEM